jgi:hypothetical protein
MIRPRILGFIIASMSIACGDRSRSPSAASESDATAVVGPLRACRRVPPLGVDDVAEFVVSTIYGAVLTDDALYYAGAYSDGADLTRIYRVSLRAADPMNELWSGPGHAQDLGLRGDKLVFAHDPGDGARGTAPASAWSLMAVPVTGGVAATLFKGDIKHALAVDRGIVVQHGMAIELFTDALTPVCVAGSIDAIAADNTRVVWSRWQGIDQCAFGGARSNVVPLDSFAKNVALDAQYVYFTDGTLRRAQLTGGAPETVVDASVARFTLTDDKVVWAARDSAYGYSLSISPKTGAPPRQIAKSDSQSLVWFGARANRAYWIDESSNIACLHATTL